MAFCAMAIPPAYRASWCSIAPGHAGFLDTRQFIDPFDLHGFLDAQDGFKLRVDRKGNPLLRHFGQIYDRSRSIPYDHTTHVVRMLPITDRATPTRTSCDWGSSPQ